MSGAFSVIIFVLFSTEGQRGPDATGDPDPIWAEVFRAAVLDLKDPWKGEKKETWEEIRGQWFEGDDYLCSGGLID